MLVYLIKSTACMAIFLLFYKLLLEKESMHKFKRFYLLGSLLLALIIPTIMFTEYVEAPAAVMTSYTEKQPLVVSNDIIGVAPALEADVIDIEPILWTIYFLGLLFFGLKFVRNLFQIFSRIRKNPKHHLPKFTHVLLQEKIAPHTFFSYIFLNKKKLESNEIPQEVLLHEETHAQQKHSYDVVLVELLQAIFWVNPFIYFAKKAIKLNHEFLADQAVLQKDVNQSTYQNTLLSYLSPDSEKKYQPLANSINYSSIKKRFTIMKTQTSKKAILLRSLLLLPLLAALVFGFAETKFEERFTNVNPSRIINDIVVDIDSHGNLSLNDKKLGLYEIGKESKRLTSYCTTGERKNFVVAHILYDENHLEAIESIQSQLIEVGIHQVNHVSKNTSSILGRPDFIPSKYHNKTIDEARAIQKEASAWYESIWFDIKNEDEIWYEGKLIALDNLAVTISNIASGKSEANDLKIQFYSTGILHSNFVDKINFEARKAGAKEVQVFTEEYIMPEDDYQDKIDPRKAQVQLKTNKMTFENERATKEQLVKYNSLAKKYNAIAIEKRVIPLQDLNVLEKVFRKMSEDQKSENQPFPECLPQGKEASSDVSLSNFDFVVTNTKTGLKFKGISGSYWTEMSFTLPLNRSQKVDRAGMVRVTEEEFNSFLLAFKKINTTTIEISGLKGTAWKDLSFTLGENESKRINHLGMVKEKTTKGASPKQMSEYNALAKEYNTMLSKSRSIQIKMKDVEKLKFIYGLMSAKQIANAELFPQFPEPPPMPKELVAPKAPRVPNVREGASNTIQKIIEEQDPHDVVGAAHYSQIDKKGAAANIESLPKEPKAPKVLKGEVTDIPEPPTPAEPVSPLDHVIEMAKKDATFYYEGKKILSDNAIELLKKNKSLNIDSRSVKGKKPIIKISKKPIKIGHSKRPLNSQNPIIQLTNTSGGNQERMLKDSIQYSSQIEDPNRPREMYAKQIIEQNEQQAIFYHKGKKINFYKALDLVYSKRSLSLATLKPNKSNRPVVLLDRNFKNYNFKELMNSK